MSSNNFSAVLEVKLFQSVHVQGGKVIIDGFRPADLGNGTIRPEEEFPAAKFTVVVKTHCPAVSPGIVDNNKISLSAPGWRRAFIG